MSKFFDHKDRPSCASLEPFLPQIVRMLDEGKEANVIVQCSKFITYLADGSPQFVQSLLNHGAKKRLMQLLDHKDESVVVSVLRASRYLVSPKETYTTRDVLISPIKILRQSSYSDETAAEGYCDTDQRPMTLKFETPSSMQCSDSILPKKSIIASPSDESKFHSPMSKSYKSRETGTLSGSPQGIYLETKDAQYGTFIPVMDGVWQCKQCVRSDMKLLNSVWHGDGYPPVEYVKKHMRSCQDCDYSGDEVMDMPTVARLTCVVQRDHVYDDNSQHNEISINSPSRKTLNTNASQLVREEDKALVTDYVAFVMDQFQTCEYKYSDYGMTGKLRLPEGFPGIECTHCIGTKKSRCMFWVSAIPLSLVFQSRLKMA